MEILNFLVFVVFFQVIFIIIMPKTTNRTRKIPKFVRKLNQILQDRQCQDLIGWLTDGHGFQIFDASRFIEQVLPNYFKHKNMASFVRQLNMYGFNRPKQSDQNVYYHPKFIRSNLNSMRQIQRKAIDSKQSQSQDSATQINAQSQQPNKSLQDICKKLLEENMKLKKQKQILNQQVSFLVQYQQKVQQILKSQNMACNYDQNLLKYYSNNNQLNNQETIGQKNSSSDFQQKNKKHGFSFAENHQDWKSKLSYLSLKQGAKLNN